MTDFYEYTYDKFTFRVAKDRCYHHLGLWVLPEDSGIRIGVSDFWQQRNGDIAFADVQLAGSNVVAGDELASMETIKVDVSLPSPVTGTIIEVNPRLELEPEIINQDPYGAGWLAVLAAEDWSTEKGRLLDPLSYLDQIKVEAAEEADQS